MDSSHKRKEDIFLNRLSGLLDARPLDPICSGRKKRRMQDIISDVCDGENEKIPERDTGMERQPVRPWVYEDFLVRLRYCW